MMNTVNILLFLAIICTVIYGQWITEVHPRGIIEPDDDYWVIKMNTKTNKPSFPANISFFNKHTARKEYSIDCSKSDQILHYRNEIIFRTTGHMWSSCDSYYITLDEGVLYSNNIEKSQEHKHPKHWEFAVHCPYRG